MEPIDLGLAGVDLTYVRVDGQLRLQLGQVEVVIETAFDLVRDGQSQPLDPEDRASLGPVLALWPGTVQSATVGADQVLRLVLTSGAVIVVAPDRSYEAWQVVGPERRLVVCRPSGGGLAVWE